MTAVTEYVLLLDDKLNISGTMEKSRVHTAATPLHLAFSCYIFNAQNELLLTRRAIGKVAWPGVWTNSACGHPQPGEALPDAVIRRCYYELGLAIETPTLIDESFQYYATDASGIVENEYCPVFFTRTASRPQPNEDEVMDFSWIPVEQVLAGVNAVPAAYSPWMVEQLRRPLIQAALKQKIS
ncbi:isopentenyl-diphosphate Delta-isomerase [Enterobacteriaceae bacterium H20N1]|uniref:Isopentenyl-diphosphate Delta-isomerase n=1 Tax=Dryocola boscaweniae TaxID=2925397 RepID=A0A9X2WAC2_9ENTR|nr:isopentenyl-diphosphate Delta-isomerase [Dryocola boscaweniae]MCT4704033.1 isopentenyl-diphosphate Delta-isomerase [Dryocola boscaweniae]MCT4717212.1 isopentenyl-diphosphate Delta-isomerase [Dryocola boscaweniae]MCT4721201.1 isopentenyl-diphosphate Delta-isomerase [Dryocola boscaweniae]